MAKGQTRRSLTPAELYSAAIQFHNNEFRTLGERTVAFLIIQSILVAALVHVITIPVPVLRQTFAYAFYPVAFGICTLGILFCVLHYVAGLVGSKTALRWRQYMQGIENNQQDPWKSFFNKCSEHEKSLFKSLPLPGSWLFSTAIFLWAWFAAVTYLVLRYMPEHGIDWVSAPTLGILIPIFILFLSITIWRLKSWHSGVI